MKIVPKAHLNSSLLTITYYLLLKAGMARQKGLVQSRSGSVEPSPATLIRVAFDFSSPPTWRLNLARQKGLEPLTYCLEG